MASLQTGANQRRAGVTKGVAIGIISKAAVPAAKNRKGTTIAPADWEKVRVSNTCLRSAPWSYFFGSILFSFNVFPVARCRSAMALLRSVLARSSFDRADESAVWRSKTL